MKYALTVTFLGITLVLSGAGCGTGGANSGNGQIQGLIPSDYSLSFDGMDDLASTTGMHAVNAFTVEAWVKPTSVAANGMYRGIVGHPGSFVLGTSDANAGQWFLTQCSPGCDAGMSPVGDLAVGVWQHLAAVYNGQSLVIYRNGTPIASKAKTGDTTNFTGLLFGRWAGSFDGLIDEVRFWDHARTAGQISTTMGSVLSGLEFGLIGYWRFEEGIGQSANDSSPEANAAQLGSTGLVDADDPTWVNEGAPVG